MADRVGLSLPLLWILSLSALAEVPIADDKAEIFTQGTLEITDPWVQSAVGEAHTARVFFEFRNRGKVADQLVSARSSSAASCAFRWVSHAKAESVKTIEFPSGGEAFELSQHGYYIELAGLTAPLTMGKRFPLELTFTHAGQLAIEVTSRFHSPKLARRIRAAARRGDTDALRRLKRTLDQP